MGLPGKVQTRFWKMTCWSPDASVEKAIAEQLGDIGDDLWENAGVGVVLSSGAHLLSPTGPPEPPCP